MATLIYTELHCREAQRYADLSGIRYDLEDAKKFALLFIGLTEGFVPPPDMDICEALSIACLIKYWRCFGKGVRKPLIKLESDILSSLPSELQEHHKIFGLWRNKNIAHSVDECEQNQPHARYNKENPALGFYSIGCTSTALKTISTDDAKNMVRLVDAIIEKLDPIIKDEAKKLHAWASKQPFDELIEAGNPLKPKSYVIGRPREID